MIETESKKVYNINILHLVKGLTDMKALLKLKKGDGYVEIAECEKPVPKKDEVLIRVHYTGICGTDIHILHDQFSYWPPVIMGHEFSGVIEETGAEVTGLKKGDRVVGEPHNLACGKCHLCRSGKIQICDSKRSIGWGINGAFAPYLVMPEKLLHKIPGNVSMQSAAMAEPCAIVAHQLLERTGVTVGDYVVIMGMGTIAVLAAQMAKAAGASRVVMCGCDSDTGMRLDIVNKLNCCDLFVNVQREDIISLVKKETEGKGADISVEASGAEAAIGNAVGCLKKTGRLCAIGLSGKKEISFPWNEAMTKAIDVQFNMSSSYNGWVIALKMLESKTLRVDGMIKIMELEEWKEAFDMLEKGKAMKILLNCKE